MSILSFQGLGKYYGAQDVFANLEGAIARGDKVALVGPNGAGKTTLLRIILGLEEPSVGEVQRARGLRIGYLPQKPELSSQQTLYGEMLDVFAALREQQRQLAALADEMAASSDPDLLERYAQAEHRFDHAGGYEYENHIRRVLSGLSFGAETYDWPIGVLSGGQITRALLAKLLLQEPELLILDEPTNYLDLAALEWLETYLQEWKQSLLIVSHDRYFLDKVVTRVWELNYGTLEAYRGNYTSYVVQREERMERRQREYDEQQELIAETEEFIRRYKAGQRTKEARGRELRLNRLERIEAPKHDKHIRLRLNATLRSGEQVLLSEGGAIIGYPSRPDADPAQGPTPEHVLLDTGDFLIRRGARVALLGPNGSGKTTFLRTILGEIPPLRGRIRLGASVKIGYLPQKQDWLDPDRSALDAVLDAKRMELEAARNVLGRFLFSGDDVYKRIGDLSGGERSRVALAILTLQGANFLLLDEPTTHLDVASQEILQSVLDGFDGTILLVSHDRYLIDAMATHVWMVRDGRLHQYEGNYQDYLAAREQERAAAQTAAVTKAAPEKDWDERRRRDRAEQRSVRQKAERLQALESEIEQHERQLSMLTQMMDLASSHRDLARLQSLSRDYQQLEATLAERLEEWERAASAQEEA